MKLEGKVAIITGAGGDIGKEIARQFVAEGAKIVIAGRNVAKLEKAAAEIGISSDDYVAVSTDISDEAAVEALVETAKEKFGKLDIMVCNSGLPGDVNAAVDYSVEKFDQVVAVNLRGTFLCMKYALKSMIPAGGGAIVVTASIGGLKGMPGTIGYNATKFAINGMVKTVSTDHARDGIRCNSVCPSPVEGEMMRGTEAAYGNNAGGVAAEDIKEGIAAGIPMGRYAQPAEIAAATLFLASDEASFISGVNLPVDGGMAAS